MDQWNDPRTLIAIAGTTIGIVGFLFAIVSHLWIRREKRHDVLATILTPMTDCLQAMIVARNAREKREQLMFSYPTPENEAMVQTVDRLMDQYGEAIEDSAKSFRKAQSQLHASSLRFPKSLAMAIQDGQETLAELGRLVNAGIHHKAELEIAKYRDNHARVIRLARGWEVAGPLELLRRRSAKREEVTEDSDFEFDLSEREMNRVLEMFHRRATTQAKNTFAVHPPQKLIDDPGIAESETVIDQLKDSIFTVVFQDGATEMLALHELVAFTYELIAISATVQEAMEMLDGTNPGVTQLSVTHNLCMREIMRPSMVQLILSKIEFSNQPSDGPAEAVHEAS